MATIEPYETKAGKRWRVRYRKPDRRQTDKRGFKTKREAQAFANAVEVDKRQGAYVDPTRGRVLLRDIGKVWVNSLTHVKPQTADMYESAYRVHVEAAFGGMPVAAIDAASVRTWVAELAKRRKPPTVRRAYRVLHAILASAVADRLIPTNPADGIKLPHITSRKNVYLRYEQVERLADCAGEYRHVVYLAAYAGLRWGEIAALTPGNVVPGGVRVEATVTQRRGLSTPKAGTARTVGLPSFIDLSALPSDWSRPRTSFGWWKQAKAEAGLPEELRFHDLRHSAASFAVQSGASVKLIQNMLGHASAKTTLDTYADLWEEDIGVVAGLVEAARSAAIVGKTWAEGPSGDDDGPRPSV